MVLPFFNSCPRYLWGCTCLGRTFRHPFRFHYPFPCKIQYIFRISKLGFMDDRLKAWHIFIIFGFAIFSQFLPWLPISLRVFFGCRSLSWLSFSNNQPLPIRSKIWKRVPQRWSCEEFKGFRFSRLRKPSEEDYRKAVFGKPGRYGLIREGWR